MDQFAMLIILLLCLVQKGCSRSNSNLEVPRKAAGSSNDFNVVNYGALGNGKNDDSQAFLKAWKDLCGGNTSNQTMIIPEGKSFLLKPLTFNGPCKSANVHIQVSGNIIAPNEISAWTGYDKSNWLVFSNVDGLIIDGWGKIDGQGSIWWKTRCGLDYGSNGACQRPTALSFQKCNGLRLSGLTHLNSQRNHISISGCNGAKLSNLKIIAPEDSPNTDGIDISHSSYIQITDSSIGTGDDCIAINSGTSFLNITNVACGPGHGISVGSLGFNFAYDTVEEIHVHKCNFTRTMNGVRIKTWQGGSGYARRISFNEINFEQVNNPIIIDQYYCGGGSLCNINHTKAVAINDVKYTNIFGSSASVKAINLSCSKDTPCTYIKMLRNNITSAEGNKITSFCYKAQGKARKTVPRVACLV